MWDRRKWVEGGENVGSLVSYHRARHEAGREAVCSRGQRRLPALVSRSSGSSFPCPAQVSGSSLLKSKDRGQDWALRPHLLSKEPGGGGKLVFGKVRLCVSCRVAHVVFIPRLQSPSKVLRCRLDAFRTRSCFIPFPPQARAAVMPF